MAKTKTELKPTQNVFEARYEQGYRYLDRCGDAMVILEKTLPEISNGEVWMPEEMQPTGARMKCPAFEITIVFDSGRLCVDQNPIETKCEFSAISECAFNTVRSKFGVGKIKRFGNRRRYILPRDSVEDAEALSLRKSPVKDWLETEINGMKPRAVDVTKTWENEDRSKGVRVSIGPIFRVEAPLKLDKRLTMAPHQLDKGQREALISQIKRQKQREKDPLAGLQLDIDFWWLNPEETSVELFLQSSEKRIGQLCKSYLGTR